MAPSCPPRIRIHNLTRSHLSLTNSSHPFLEPVLLLPSSLGPLAFLPSSSRNPPLDLLFSVHGSGTGKQYRISLSKRGKGKSWRRSRWMKVEVVETFQEELDPRPSSSTGQDTLHANSKGKMELRAFRVKNADGSQSLLLFETPPLDSWMSEMPDSTSLGEMVIPGTHQSTALYGWPVSQCQQPATPLDVQLRDGIRFLDVRLAEKNGKLIAYHGIVTQRALFTDLLVLLTTFLTSPTSCNETILLSIQQENTSTPLFLSLLRSALLDPPSSASFPRSRYHLSNTIPRIGDVRGKIVLFSRFGGQDGRGWEDVGGMGIHPTGWEDSKKEGFEVRLPEGDRKEGVDKGEGGWTLGIQDWYNIYSILSIPEKAYAVQTRLAVETPLSKHVALTFCSAAALPFAMPVTVARGFGWGWLGVEGVNGRMGRWLTARLMSGSASTRRAGEEEKEKVLGVEKGGEDAGREGAGAGELLNGWILFDFYKSEKGLVELLLAFNFL